MLTILELRLNDSDQITIVPCKDIDPSTPIGEIFAHGSIEISLYSATNHAVTMGVDAPECLSVQRKKAIAA
ncbi:MAG TPA: hypothetical protein PKK10_01260 [Woeseiaceae bacterium]|nr:hypothetical protein [Woeseiaceae bacterium]